MFLAISSDKLIILETFIPAAGSNSLSVTTGPLLTFLILPSTPKSNKIFSKKSVFVFSSLLIFSFSFFLGTSSNFTGGRVNFFVALILSLF